jgi:hypothetical protein
MNAVVMTKYFENQGDKRAVPMTNSVQCKLAMIALCLLTGLVRLTNKRSNIMHKTKEDANICWQLTK